MKSWPESAGSRMKFKVVIPARLGSTRLPRKVLREIHGRPLVRYVWEAAQKSAADQVVIATDDEQVFAVCRDFGADVRMTAATHNSGTDRASEIAQTLGWGADTIVVNLQGDEPLMPPELVRQVAQLLADDTASDIATLCHPLHSREEWLNPNVVKLVMDAQNRALYFSRAPIPWKRQGTNTEAVFPQGLAFRHIGLYAYRVAALKRFAGLPPHALEDCEALEQLRALAAGMLIKVGIIDTPPPRGVDTEDDLRAVMALLPQP
jgi:3-deoxy-manno-octulosonate cytidylyltransferase (CMP-KDO synthetase)